MAAQIKRTPASVVRRNAKKVKLPDKSNPHWRDRSKLVVLLGRYRMRNGHTAEILTSKTLTYMSGQTDNGGRKERKFIIWYGRCVECNEAFGWNANGTYAAVGRHPFDLVSRLK